MMSFKMSFISNKKMLLRLKKTLPSSRSFTIEFKYTLISSPFEPLKRKIFWTNNFQWDKKMCYGMLSFFCQLWWCEFHFLLWQWNYFLFPPERINRFHKMLSFEDALLFAPSAPPFVYPLGPYFLSIPWFFSWIQCNVVVFNRTLMPPTFLQIFTFIIRLTDNLRQCVNSSEICLSHR